MLVAKLRGARERKRKTGVKVDGRKNAWRWRRRRWQRRRWCGPASPASLAHAGPCRARQRPFRARPYPQTEFRSLMGLGGPRIEPQSGHHSRRGSRGGPRPARAAAQSAGSRGQGKLHGPRGRYYPLAARPRTLAPFQNRPPKPSLISPRPAKAGLFSCLPTRPTPE